VRVKGNGRHQRLHEQEELVVVDLLRDRSGGGGGGGGRGGCGGGAVSHDVRVRAIRGHVVYSHNAD